MKYDNYLIKLLYFTAIIILTLNIGGCAEKTNHKFYFSEKGIVRAKLSQHEIESAQKEIQNFEKYSSIPEGMKGGILFDGTAISLSIDSERNSVVTFRILKMLLKDSNDPSPNTLTVISPPLDYGGLEFKVGTSYRIFAVKLNNKYQTWGATGTPPVNEK